MGDTQLYRLTAGRLRAVGNGILFWLVVAPPAVAEIQPYQVRRLLAMRTTCQVADLTTTGDTGKERRYHASCTNLAVYPNGVEVRCADRQDERSCEVMTKANSFDHLHLLQSERP